MQHTLEHTSSLANFLESALTVYCNTQHTGEREASRIMHHAPSRVKSQDTLRFGFSGFVNNIPRSLAFGSAIYVPVRQDVVQLLRMVLRSLAGRSLAGDRGGEA